MPGLPLLAGLALFLLLMLFLRGYTGTNPRNMTRGFRLSGGVLLALATVALATAGRINFAVLTGIAAWTLLFGARPPWQRTSYGPSGAGPGQARGSSGLPQAGAMSRAEALTVLGLREGASEAEIRAAHRRLIQQTHPDKGGTDYLAAKINEAKEVLLRRR
jgi:DnaJ domain